MYIPVTDVDQLVEAFDSLGPGTPLAPRPPVVPCDRVPCRQGSLPFQLSQSLSGFHLLLNVGAAPVIAELRSPGAREPLVLRTGEVGSTALGTAGIEYRPASDVHIVVDARLPSRTDDWVGTWTVTFVDPTGEHANAPTGMRIRLIGGLAAVVEEPPTLHVGQDAPVEITIEDAEGAPRDPRDLTDSLEVTATVAVPGGAEQALSVQGPRADGSYGATITAAGEIGAGSVELRVTLGIVTRDGLRLDPRTATYRLPVELPPSYPRVEPAQLPLTSIIDEGDARGRVTIIGGLGGGGCAWFGEASFPQVPPGAGSVSATYDPPALSPGTCIRVGPGERQDVQVVATPREVRAGRVSGEIKVVLSSDEDPGAVQVRTVPVAFDMDRDVPLGKAGLLFVLLLLAGIGIPVGVMYLVNWWTAKFSKPGLARRATKRVTVTGGTVREETGDPLGVSRQDFDAMRGVDPDSARRFDFEGLAFAAKVPPLPVQLPYGTVVSSAGKHTLASDGQASANGTLVGRVPLALPGTWVFVVDKAEAAPGGDRQITVTGTLSLYVSHLGVEKKAQRLASKARVELPAALQEAAGVLRGGLGPPARGSGSSPSSTGPGYEPPVPMD